MINIGDMLSRHTNNVLKSTVHRVVNPDKELLRKSRYSIPFFMHPVSEMKLNVLDSCVCDEFPKAYDDITAGEFLEERLIELNRNHLSAMTFNLSQVKEKSDTSGLDAPLDIKET